VRPLGLALLFVFAATAQDFRGQIRMKPLVPPLREPGTLHLEPAAAVSPAPPRLCAVPLARVTPRDVDPKMIRPPSESPAAPIPIVTPPAPACDERPRQ